MNQTVEGLIERFEKATGPDRELDARLFWAFDHAAALRAYWNGAIGTPQPMDEFPRSRGLGYSNVVRLAPTYTASIDAALALTERLHGDNWYSILLDAVRALGVAGTQGPEHLAKYVILATLRALQQRGRE
jgi:hypothetical protein